MLPPPPPTSLIFNGIKPDVDVHELGQDGEEDGIADRKWPRAPAAVALGDRVEAVLGVDRHLAVALVVLLRASDVVLLALGALELVAGRTELLIRLPATTL